MQFFFTQRAQATEEEEKKRERLREKENGGQEVQHCGQGRNGR